MANTVTKATVYNKLLDSVVQAGLTSAPLTANASRVVYNGGNSVKIAKLSVGGFGTYNRDTGYPAGAATLAWETFTMAMDRGIKFNVDVMDEDETMGTLSAANIIAEFGKNQEAPEVDAYRYSSIMASILADSVTRYGYYSPVVATVLSQFNTDVGVVRGAVGRSVPLYAFMAESAFTVLSNSTQLTKILETQMSGEFQVQTDVYSVNGVKIIPVPDARLKSEYAFSSTNGFSAKPWAQQINWILVSPEATIAFAKHNKMKVIGADMNPDADADLVTARLYHDCWTFENKRNMIYISLKTAAPGAVTGVVAGSGKVEITLGADYTNRDTGHKFYYIDTDSATAPAVPAVYDVLDPALWTEIDAATKVSVTVTATHYCRVVQLDEKGRVLQYSAAAAT
jgi:hypothetical protein